jgi:hypothetical protein
MSDTHTDPEMEGAAPDAGGRARVGVVMGRSDRPGHIDAVMGS